MAVNEIGEIIPPIDAADEFATVETRYGPMDKWKARALSIGWFQRMADSVRNDATDVTPVRDEDKPPPVVADAKNEDKETETRLDAAWLKRVEDMVSQLDVRLGILEARKRAEQALEDAEAEVERMMPPDDDETFH